VLANPSGRAVEGSAAAGIAGSNFARGMDVCLLSLLCVVRQRSLRWADLSSRGVLPRSVIVVIIIIIIIIIIRAEIAQSV
jgi:hypothetical protein